MSAKNWCDLKVNDKVLASWHKNIMDGEVIMFSPSKNYVKVRFQYDDSARWLDVSDKNIVLLEVFSTVAE